MTWPWASWLRSSTVRSNWAAFWSASITPVTTDSFGTPRFPRMSAGGSSLLTMACILDAPGARATVVPSDNVTWRRANVGFEPLLRAEATTPPRSRNTARPRTMRAGPRTDMGS